MLFAEPTTTRSYSPRATAKPTPAAQENWSGLNLENRRFGSTLRETNPFRGIETPPPGYQVQDDRIHAYNNSSTSGQTSSAGASSSNPSRRGSSHDDHPGDDDDDNDDDPPNRNPGRG